MNFDHLVVSSGSGEIGLNQEHDPFPSLFVPGTKGHLIQYVSSEVIKRNLVNIKLQCDSVEIVKSEFAFDDKMEWYASFFHAMSSGIRTWILVRTKDI